MIGSSADGRPVRFFFMLCIGWTGMRLFGTIASAFAIAQTQSISEFFMSGSMAKVLTQSAVILILLMRPQGLFSSKVRK